MAMTACVRLSTPSFCRMAETCALMVASDTPSLKAICLLSRPSPSIMSTRTCCGVSVESRETSSALSPARHAAEIDVGRQPHLAADDPADRLADALHGLRLRYEARRAAVEALADGGGIVAGGDDHHRHLGVLRAQVEEPRHPVHARHGEVEQDEVDLARRRQPVGQLVERARLQHLGIGERRAQRLAQRPAKQGMVIDDDEPVIRHARAKHPRSKLEPAGAAELAHRWQARLESSGFLPEWLMSRAVHARMRALPAAARRVSCTCRPSWTTNCRQRA